MTDAIGSALAAQSFSLNLVKNGDSQERERHMSRSHTSLFLKDFFAYYILLIPAWQRLKLSYRNIWHFQNYYLFVFVRNQSSELG